MLSCQPSRRQGIARPTLEGIGEQTQHLEHIPVSTNYMQLDELLLILFVPATELVP